MTPAVIGLVLCAALLHATWNAMLRSRADQLWSVTVMSFAATAVAIPAALLLPLPARVSWPYLGLSAVLQLGYSLTSPDTPHSNTGRSLSARAGYG